MVDPPNHALVVGFHAGKPRCDDDRPDKSAIRMRVDLFKGWTRNTERLDRGVRFRKETVDHYLTSKVGAPALVTIIRDAAMYAGDGDWPGAGSILR